MKPKDKKLIFLILLMIGALVSCGQEKTVRISYTKESPEETKEYLLAGSHRVKDYKSNLMGKSVAVIGNQTSTIGNMHLVDALLRYDIKVKKIFSPEHGFRGDGDAGAHQMDYIDEKTGLPVVSLYGSKKKPSASDLEGIDVVVFDIQDVGARFYTYISTMTYAIESCA